MLPPAWLEPSQRLVRARSSATCRPVEHLSTPGCKHPDAPDTQRARPSKMRASRSIGVWRKSTGDHGSRMDRCARSEKNPSSTGSAVREPPVSPPKTHRSRNSSDLAPRRLAPYRLDAPTPSAVSRRGHRCSTTWCFHHRHTESDCPTLPASESSILDVAAEDRVPPIRLPQSLGCLETARTMDIPLTTEPSRTHAT
jgi:hypothetical protein